jgi:hypothetical protein
MQPFVVSLVATWVTGSISFTSNGFSPILGLFRPSLLSRNNVYRSDKHVDSTLLMAGSQGVSARVSGSWYPRPFVDEDEFDGDDEVDDVLDDKKWFYANLEQKSVALMARLIKQRLTSIRTGEHVEGVSIASETNKAFQMARGRFLDLTCRVEGEQVLESLFDDDEAAGEEVDVVKGAIIALQSLTMVGCQVGVKGSPEQLERRVSHLQTVNDDVNALRDLDVWDADSIRRLKYRVDQTAGLQLLAEIKWKRSAQGAFDLLVALGAWTKHEDLSLLRSGFPLRFTEEDEEAAKQVIALVIGDSFICINARVSNIMVTWSPQAAANTHDPDELLGIRRNLCNHKVYTIDGASTTDIDDGLSVEVVQSDDGSERHRLWVHISDSDHFAPRYSRIFQVAKRRATSLYLPQGSIPMFPSR